MVEDLARCLISSSISGDLTGNGPQVIGDNAPPDPAVHTVLPLIETAAQAEAAFEQTDTGLQAGAPIASRTKPGLCLMGLPSRRASARLGNSHLLDRLLPGVGVPFGRKELTVGGQQMRRLVKNLPMMVEAGAEWVGIGRVAGQDGLAADEAAFHCIQPDHPAKRDVFADFAFADKGRVTFKQADQLVAGRPALALQHAALGLAHDLLEARDKRAQLVDQALSGRLTDALSSVLGRLGLLQQGLTDREQGLVGALHRRVRFLPAPLGSMNNTEPGSPSRLGLLSQPPLAVRQSAV